MKYETKWTPPLSKTSDPSTWFHARCAGFSDCPACSRTGFVTILGRPRLSQGMWRLDREADKLIYGQDSPPVGRAIRCSCEYGHNRCASFGPAYDEVFGGDAPVPSFSDADKAGLERALARWGAQPRGGEAKTMAVVLPKVAQVLPVAETATIESVIAGIRDDELPF